MKLAPRKCAPLLALLLAAFPAGCESEDPVDEDCLGVVCDEPPDATCDGSTLVSHEETGTCVDGRCEYPETRTPCPEGTECVLGECVSKPNDDPCADVVCDDPPDPFCDGSTAVSYAEQGSCVEGECEYPEERTTCSAGTMCAEGLCVECPYPEAVCDFFSSLESASSDDLMAVAREGLRSIEIGPGLPLFEDEHVTFLYLDDDRGRSLSIAADFNDWSDTQHRMERHHRLPNLAFARISAPPESRRCSYYKFVAGGDTWLQDPRSRRFVHDSVDGAPIALLSSCPGESHLERLGPRDWQYPAEDRPIVLWVPPDMDASHLHPLFVMHDGQNLFDPRRMTWDVAEAAQTVVSSGLTEPVIIAGIPHAEDRLGEYIPWHVPELGGGGADAYGDFLEHEVLPAIQERYPIDTGSHLRTSIGGSSLGGLVSMYLAITRPHVFGQVMSMSGSYWLGEIGTSTEGEAPTIRGMVESWAPEDVPELRVYLDSGTRSSDDDSFGSTSTAAHGPPTTIPTRPKVTPGATPSGFETPSWAGAGTIERSTAHIRQRTSSPRKFRRRITPTGGSPCRKTPGPIFGRISICSIWWPMDMDTMSTAGASASMEP